MQSNNHGKSDASICGAWVTIGSFDGIHKGHQRIIKKIVGGARKFGERAIVVTFFPHPTEVLGKKIQVFYLNTPEEKDEIFKNMGVDSVLTFLFDKELSRMSTREFIGMLHRQLDFSCLLIGYDFRLGADRKGDIHTLRDIGEELGYCIRAIDPLKKRSSPVSSSAIRALIKEGNVQKAAALLGRDYEVRGEIIHGDGRGKHIGIPTANMMPWKKKVIPGIGVYAAFARLGGCTYKAVVNIGCRPTFYEQPVKRTIEVHLLDFNRNIYGETIRMFFVKHIRSEEKFDSAEALMRKIQHDIEVAKKVLSRGTAKKHIPT